MPLLIGLILLMFFDFCSVVVLWLNEKTSGKHSPFQNTLKKIDQEASRQKRSRSEYMELLFEDVFARQ
jgi:hypothetical protein